MRLTNTDMQEAKNLVKRIYGAVTAFAIVMLIGSCSHEEPVVEKTGPKVEGNVVTLPEDTSQSGSLSTAEVAPVAKPVTHVSGHLTWNEDATVRVFASVAGRVNSITANPGDKVKAGDTLATMESVDFGQAQADASKAEADLKLAERTLERLNDLLKHGAAARKDVEAAEDDLENKKADRARAFARLKQYGVTAGTVDGVFPLKSPLSGTIVGKNINPGQEVRPDQMLANDAKIIQPLFVISDPSKLSVILDVTELDIGALKPGQPLKIRTRAYPDREFQGKLEFIGDSIDPVTRTVKARGFVVNSDGLLKAEMFVGIDADGTSEAKPPAPPAQSLADGVRMQAAPVEVPTSAVFLKENQHFVFVERAPGKFERKAVEVGREHDGRVSVTDGLEAGERVVTNGALLLQTIAEGSKG
jgi:membrane fusion protein, heavy metal efflux system